MVLQVKKLKYSDFIPIINRSKNLMEIRSSDDRNVENC